MEFILPWALAFLFARGLGAGLRWVMGGSAKPGLLQCKFSSQGPWGPCSRGCPRHTLPPTWRSEGRHAPARTPQWSLWGAVHPRTACLLFSSVLSEKRELCRILHAFRQHSAFPSWRFCRFPTFMSPRSASKMTFLKSHLACAPIGRFIQVIYLICLSTRNGAPICSFVKSDILLLSEYIDISCQNAFKYIK